MYYNNQLRNVSVQNHDNVQGKVVKELKVMMELKSVRNGMLEDVS